MLVILVPLESPFQKIIVVNGINFNFLPDIATMSIYLHCYHCIQSLLMRPRIQPFADKQLSRTRSHARN